VRLRLVVPLEVETPTGGNTYDLALAGSLRRAGDLVQLVRAGPSDLPDVVRRPWDGPTLMDGLLACARPEAVRSPRVAVLVHMPLALETGLAPEQAATIDRREREALRGAALVVATSRWAAQHLAEHHGLTGVAVAPPGVDPAPIGVGSDPPLFVHVAALLPHKDQLGVVAALGGLADLPWQARLAGSVDRDPAYASAVRSAVRAAGLRRRIDIAGELPRDAAWTGADLALLPSLVETFGLVVTEALARGVPAVVSAGGPAEALGRTPTGDRPGVVVPAGDRDALQAALRRWLTDQGHRRRLRAVALARRQTLAGWDTTADHVRQALRHL
jgi:glycosyltransferase involved in cell wall biosynthesis